MAYKLRGEYKINQELVSLIMPTFNRASLLIETVNSCLAQTHTNIELIIVDGKSTDGTSTVMSDINDPRVRFIESNVYLRRSKARNIGIEIATGEYISFIDSDDLFLPSKIAEDLRILKLNKNAGAVYTSAKCINEETGEIIGYYDASKSGNLYDDFVFYLPLVIATSQITITREVLNKVGSFDEDLDRFEDTDYFRRISKVTAWNANPERLVVLKNHSDNRISNQSQKVIIEMINKYVSKANKEIKENNIETTATPVNLYLYYAQAFFMQKNGLRNAYILYRQVFFIKPAYVFRIGISILKMLKARIVKT